MAQHNDYLKTIENNLWLTEYDRNNLKISYRIKEIIAQAKSDFQDIMILDSYDFGPMLVLDGVVQSTALDGAIYNEMMAHVPLSHHPNPEKVLIIGGGDCGVAKEVCKHTHVKTIHMVEIDELVIRLSKEHLKKVSGNLSDPRVHFIYDNGVQFVSGVADNTYDIIIVDSSDPVGAALILFEMSFYKDIHRILKKDGLMVCQSQSPVFHKAFLRQTFDRIGQLFPITKLYWATIPTYPGGFWSFILGTKKYDELIETHFDYDTQYVNQSLLSTCFELPVFMEDIIR